MVYFQIIILILILAYIIFSSINFMDNYSKESREQFSTERNFKIGITIIIFVVLYFAGTFNLIFQLDNKNIINIFDI